MGDTMFFNSAVQIHLSSGYLDMSVKEFLEWEPDMIQKVEFEGAEVLLDVYDIREKTTDQLVEKVLSLKGKPLLTFGDCCCVDCWGGHGQYWCISNIVEVYHGRAEYVVHCFRNRDWSHRISLEEVRR